MLNAWKSWLFLVIPVLQAILILFLIVYGFLQRRERRGAPSARFVSLNQLLLWVGFLTGGILSVPVTLFSPDTMSKSVWFILEACVLLGLVMLLAYCNQTVSYDKDGFTAGSLLGIKRRYAYGDITGLARRGHDTVLYCGRRRILLDSIAMGTDSFVNYADQMRRKQTGKGIPLRERSYDPMNGNLDTPWLYFIIYFLLFAFSVFFIPFLIINVLMPADGKLPTDTTEFRTSFISWNITRDSSGTLLLYAPDDEMPFSIDQLYGFEVPLPEPDSLCSGESYIVVARDGEKEHFVYTLASDDGTPILTAYDCDVAYRNTQRGASFIIIIFLVLFILTGIFGILVGRNPESYPHWFRKLFYQDWAWISSRSAGYIKRRK